MLRSETSQPWTITIKPSPMPNPLSRWAHQKPHWWYKTEMMGSHIIQLVMQWFVFFPQPIASIAAVVIIFQSTGVGGGAQN